MDWNAIIVLVISLAIIASLNFVAGASDSEDSDTAEPYYVKIEVVNYEAYADPHKGSFVIKVMPEWAPLSAKRFAKLVKSKFYDNTRFFGVKPDEGTADMKGYAQFGIKKGKYQKKWDKRPLKDEPFGVMSNFEGTVAFWADPKEHSRGRRCTSVVVNRVDNSDKYDHKHAPFGYVALHLHEVKIMPWLSQKEEPRIHTIRMLGNEYLDKNFTKLTQLVRAEIVEESEVLNMLIEGEELAETPVFSKFGEYDEL